MTKVKRGGGGDPCGGKVRGDGREGRAAAYSTGTAVQYRYGGQYSTRRVGKLIPHSTYSIAWKYTKWVQCYRANDVQGKRIDSL